MEVMGITAGTLTKLQSRRKSPRHAECSGALRLLHGYEARRMPRLSNSSRSDSDRPPQMP